mgnify:CR=1 FL=1|tara:strand:- start:598 stop:885 length:288 start_codon:yes stop_codon:yes gene_type:complete
MRDLAIRNTHSTVVSISGDKDATDEQGNVVVLDEALIQEEVSRLQAEYDNKQYARDRAEAYPSIAVQLDDIYHNGVEGWKATIQAVKDTYPKGGN